MPPSTTRPPATTTANLLTRISFTTFIGSKAIVHEPRIGQVRRTSKTPTLLSLFRGVIKPKDGQNRAKQDRREDCDHQALLFSTITPRAKSAPLTTKTATRSAKEKMLLSGARPTSESTEFADHVAHRFIARRATIRAWLPLRAATG